MELNDDSILGLGSEAATMPTTMSSLPCTPLEEEERPSSSLSTASRSSRIPRLTRSASLRIKSTPDNKTSAEGKSKSETRPSSQSASRGLVRSASFVTSRGMGGISSPSIMSTSHHHHHHSSSSSTHRVSSSRSHRTPETPRKFSHGSNSSFSRRNASAVERKTHSYAGLGTPVWPFPNYLHSQHRRPNFLPISTASMSASYGPSSLPLTPASQPDTPSKSPETDLDDGGGEADSVKSFGSVSSALSCDAALARHHNQGKGAGGSNSGSCWGGSRNRNSKYVLHCSHNHELDPDTYLTPTQRAARKIRELKALLAEARRDVQVRDVEISRLTRELVELRLLKARNQKDEGTSAADESSQTPDLLPDEVNEGELHPNAAPTTLTPKSSSTPSEGSDPELSRLLDNLNAGTSDSGVSRIAVASPAAGSGAETTEDSVDLTRSLADSGHYDDLTSPCLSSRDPFEASRNSLKGQPTDEDEDEVDPWAAVEETERRLQEEFEHRVDQLKRNHMDEYHELKEKHNDRVESLLSKLSDANLKYFELRPLYDRSQERIRELERETTKLKDELSEAELRHQKMYLQMFLKGQQAAKMQADDEQVWEEGSPSISNGPMVDLLKQLARTEEELEKMKVLYRREVDNRKNNNKSRNGELDPEVTLQFLKSAIYYFLTDKDNAKGHLRAIESILGYTDMERHNIDKVVK